MNPAVGDWILACQHREGGFLAAPGAPIPDLFVHRHRPPRPGLPRPAIAVRGARAVPRFRGHPWSAEGGFHGHWADDLLDAEYTYYGLLALGHLSL